MAHLLDKLKRLKEESKKRIASCEGCSFFDDKFRKCVICGCFMDAKVKLPNSECADTNFPRWGRMKLK